MQVFLKGIIHADVHEKFKKVMKNVRKYEKLF